MIQLAKILVISGAVLIVAGGLVYLFSRIGIPLGRLPGDIRIQGNTMTCLIPLATSLLLSILLTILINLFIRIVGRK